MGTKQKFDRVIPEEDESLEPEQVEEVGVKDMLIGSFVVGVILIIAVALFVRRSLVKV